MVEDIKLVKNWDVAHLQDLLLMVFWRSVKEIIIEMIGTQDGSDGEGEPVAAVLAEIGEDGGAAALGGGSGQGDEAEDSLLAEIGEDGGAAAALGGGSGQGDEAEDSLLAEIGEDGGAAALGGAVGEEDGGAAAALGGGSGQGDEAEDSLLAEIAEIGEDGGAAALGGAVGEEDGGAAAARRGAVGEVPGKLVAAGVALIEAIDAMMIAFRKVNIKAMSKDIKEKDSERDVLLREVKSMTAVMANIKSLSERQAAAKALKESMARWKLNPKHEYNREFMEVSSWLKVVAASPELTAAAEVLGMTEMITRLGELNDEVNALIDERDAALANKKAKQQRQKRKEAERRWRTFVMMLNAAALMDDDEHRYDAIVGFLNYRLKDLKKKMRHTRRMNAKKREAKESDND